MAQWAGCKGGFRVLGTFCFRQKRKGWLRNEKGVGQFIHSLSTGCGKRARTLDEGCPRTEGIPGTCSAILFAKGRTKRPWWQVTETWFAGRACGGPSGRRWWVVSPAIHCDTFATGDVRAGSSWGKASLRAIVVEGARLRQQRGLWFVNVRLAVARKGHGHSNRSKMRETVFWDGEARWIR